MTENNPPQDGSSHDRMIPDVTRLGIAVFGSDGLLACNDRFREMTVPEEGEAGPGSFLERIPTGQSEPLSRRLEALLRGDLRHLRFELREEAAGNGRRLWGEAQPIEFSGMPAVHLILLEPDAGMTPPLRDIRKEEDELKLHHDDRLAALGSMAAGIAHELNQPLNTIRVVTDGFLFGRQEGWPLDQEELFENLEMISRQVIRMDKVIQNVRNFARGEGRRADENVNANAAIENVFTMIGRQIEAHGIRVEKDLDPLLPPIRASLNELEQVVMNLIVNARQALDDSSRPHKTLTIRTGEQEGRVFIEVSDNGSGIPESCFERIFDPFFTTKEVGQGTGLGLSISQSIIHNFGGEIAVSNNPEGGATFLIGVPAIKERP